ncbi:uncharacterized protein F4812DRAFT_448328 [Daldinia caldariorum]|uniref:uncharacterized protein n=1 Tax=Daldinia caldariorum TaxID=326644 RepID=UPI002007927B|nr:uncharacterized protein F4812DRAFT_448328 [Daldinia caldariorum]KAI1463050.1 hypothetical protein F4812DRAFT_448328 [Daldinia caldariorum]
MCTCGDVRPRKSDSRTCHDVGTAVIRSRATGRGRHQPRLGRERVCLSGVISFCSVFCFCFVRVGGIKGTRSVILTYIGYVGLGRLIDSLFFRLGVFLFFFFFLFLSFSSTGLPNASLYE